LGLNNPLTVTRYHSLLIDPATLPECFEVTARSESGEIMAIRHREWDLEGCSSTRKVFSASRDINCWQTSSIGDL
jgi:hypothetical protein